MHVQGQHVAAARLIIHEDIYPQALLYQAHASNQLRRLHLG